MAKVSVIVPAYNVAAYLPRCLDSVLAQTLSDFEAICVNDGSTDNSLQILGDYAQKDKRISIINQVNRGLSVARNMGLAAAKGDYILFLDSDDCIHPQLLEITCSFAERYSADLVSFGFLRNETEELVAGFPSYDLKQLKPVLTTRPLYETSRGDAYRLLPNSWSKLYRSTILKGTQFITGICFEDFPHLYAILAKRPRTVLLKEPLYFYSTSNPNSILNQSRDTFKPRHVKDYHTGLAALCNVYDAASPEERHHLIHKVVPNYLKQQYNAIRRSSVEKQSELWPIFAEELRDLKKRGCLSFQISHPLRCLNYWKLLAKK